MSEEWQGTISLLPTTIDACRNLLMYARESADRLLGLYGQDSEIQEWAERGGFQIVGRARDNRVHGHLLAVDRPGLSAAIRAVKEGKADGIVVAHFDRLARDFPTQDDALRQIWDAGGRFFTCDPDREWYPDEPGGPEWRARRDYAEEAERELRALLRRLQNGRRRKIARGGYGGGYRIRRRYGVELVEIQGKMEYRPIPEEQEVIRRICDGLTIGSPPRPSWIKCVPLTYAGIARILNESEVATATGAPWSKKVVRDLALRGPDQIAAVVDESSVVQPLVWSKRAAG